MPKKIKVPEEARDIIEMKLKLYKKLCAIIKKKLSDAAKDEGFTTQAVSFDGAFSGKTHDFYSEIEDYLQNKEDKYANIIKLIFERNEIKSALEDCLTTREKRLVEYSYFEDMNDIEAGIRLRKRDKQIFGKDYYKSVKQYSRSTIHRMRQEIIRKLYRVGMAEDGKIIKKVKKIENDTVLKQK